MQRSFTPASCRRMASTVESTPPETPHTTSPPSFPGSSRPAVLERVHAPEAADVGRRSSGESPPLVVCVTSGWNCTPKIVPSGFDIAATGELPERAMETNPFGNSSIRSPWLIQTGISMSWRKLLDPEEEGAPPLTADAGDPVFPVLRAADLAAQKVGDQLHPVADPQHGDAKLEQLLRDPRRVGVVHAGRPAGEDYPGRREVAHELRSHVEGVDLAVDALLPHTPRDEHRVLRPEVQDEDLSVQCPTPPGSSGLPL